MQNEYEAEPDTVGEQIKGSQSDVQNVENEPASEKVINEVIFDK